MKYPSNQIDLNELKRKGWRFESRWKKDKSNLETLALSPSGKLYKVNEKTFVLELLKNPTSMKQKFYAVKAKIQQGNRFSVFYILTSNINNINIGGELINFNDKEIAKLYKNDNGKIETFKTKTLAQNFAEKLNKKENISKTLTGKILGDFLEFDNKELAKQIFNKDYLPYHEIATELLKAKRQGYKLKIDTSKAKEHYKDLIKYVMKNPTSTQLAKCRKVLSEAEREYHKPTISHYRDMKNGIVNKRADAETELVIKQGNKREYYFLDSYGKAAVLEAARHLKNVKKWSGTVYCEAYSTSGLGGATNSKVNLSDMSYKHISQRDFEQQNGTTATANGLTTYKNKIAALPHGLALKSQLTTIYKMLVLAKAQSKAKNANQDYFKPRIAELEKALKQGLASVKNPTNRTANPLNKDEKQSFEIALLGMPTSAIQDIKISMEKAVRMFKDKGGYKEKLALAKKVLRLRGVKNPTTATTRASNPKNVSDLTQLRKILKVNYSPTATKSLNELLRRGVRVEFKGGVLYLDNTATTLNQLEFDYSKQYSKNPTTATVKRASNPNTTLQNNIMKDIKKYESMPDDSARQDAFAHALCNKYKVKTIDDLKLLLFYGRDYINKKYARNGTTATVKRASNPSAKERAKSLINYSNVESAIKASEATLRELQSGIKQYSPTSKEYKIINANIKQSKDTLTVLRNVKSKGYGAVLGKANFSNTDFNSFVQKTTRKNSRMFQGKLSGEQTQLTAPNGTPKNLSRLGALKLMIVKMPNGQKANITFDKNAYLAMDIRKNLHCVGNGAKINGVKVQGQGLAELGRLIQIDYVTDKKHINGNKLTHFYHKLGEVTGETPHLFVDKERFPRIVGGNYDIWNVGIVN